MGGISVMSLGETIRLCELRPEALDELRPAETLAVMVARHTRLQRTWNGTVLVDSTNPECAGGPLRGYAPEALLGSGR